MSSENYINYPIPTAEDGGIPGCRDAASNRLACAACKYNRKKCLKEDCAMWNHFPAEKAEQFAAVQKIFGLKNLTRNIKFLDGRQQEEAVKAFEWEAMCWKQDQVRGALGQYNKLEAENKWLKALCYRLDQENKILRQQRAYVVNSPAPSNVESTSSLVGFHGAGEMIRSLQNREQMRQDESVGPIMKPLGFQGAAAHQAYPIEQNHGGPRINMGEVKDGIGEEQEQAAMGRKLPMGWINNDVADGGLMYHHSMHY